MGSREAEGGEKDWQFSRAKTGCRQLLEVTEMANNLLHDLQAGQTG
jgi:hypothetical protein